MNSSQTAKPRLERECELLREALIGLLETSDGAESGYIPGCEEDEQWQRRFLAARIDSNALIQAFAKSATQSGPDERERLFGIILAAHRAFTGGSDYVQTEARRLCAEEVARQSATDSGA